MISTYYELTALAMVTCLSLTEVWERYPEPFDSFEYKMKKACKAWAFLEAFYIKNLKPGINEGLKASRELDLFL